MAKYYGKITVKRMSELLGLGIQVKCIGSNIAELVLYWLFDWFSHQETEEALSALVVSKTIWAKIDRSVGVVNFSMSKDPNEVLNDWSGNIDQLMHLVGKINHLINKEEMIHQNYVPAMQTS